MTDPTITDLRRELAKAEDTLIACLRHLTSHAEMNAALHCSERVMYSPLHAKVEATVNGLAHARLRTEEPADGALAQTLADTAGLALLLTDLDRCQHGRHQGDPCGPADDCNGTSAGNPHLRPGQVIGYGLRGEQIVMPDRDHKHDPAAWRDGGPR